MKRLLLSMIVAGVVVILTGCCGTCNSCMGGCSSLSSCGSSCGYNACAFGPMYNDWY